MAKPNKPKQPPKQYKAAQLHDRQLVLPTREELERDGIVVTNDGFSRRLVIPMAAFWGRLKGAGRRDAETLMNYILVTFGISPQNDYEKTPELGFSTFTQPIVLGVVETHDAATEEAVEMGLAQTLICNLKDEDLLPILAKRFGFEEASLKEVLGV